MNEEELKEIIEAKNKPIRDVVELSKHFRGRRNCIVFLTESFRIDLDNRMSRLAELKENGISKDKIREIIEKERYKTTSSYNDWKYDENVYKAEKNMINILEEALLKGE